MLLSEYICSFHAHKVNHPKMGKCFTTIPCVVLLLAGAPTCEKSFCLKWAMVSLPYVQVVTQRKTWVELGKSPLPTLKIQNVCRYFMVLQPG